MPSMILQYVIIVFMVVGIGYLIYLLKDKGFAIKDDYFGIALYMLNTLTDQEATPENVKQILRAISKAVNYVESNYKDDPNDQKEAKALEMSKELLSVLNLSNPIPDESIIYLIRISATLLPAKNNP